MPLHFDFLDGDAQKLPLELQVYIVVLKTVQAQLR